MVYLSAEELAELEKKYRRYEFVGKERDGLVAFYSIETNSEYVAHGMQEFEREYKTCELHRLVKYLDIDVVCDVTSSLSTKDIDNIVNILNFQEFGD